MPRPPPPFLTALDPELAVKGSIDALGLLPLWSRFGRTVVGNLSLVASSARGYTTLLFGYYFAQRLVDEHKIPSDRFVDAFLVFEQLAGYSRTALAPEGDSPGQVRGLRRIRNKLAQSKKVPLGSSRDALILSNQRQYGLWSLFSGPAEKSGLLDRAQQRLTPTALQHVEQIADAKLPPTVQRRISKLMAAPTTFAPHGFDGAVAEALHQLHSTHFSPTERAFYLDAVVAGGPADPETCQSQLWGLLEQRCEEHQSWSEWLSTIELEGLANDAQPELRSRLRRILRFEYVVAPAAAVFGYLQDGGDTRTLAEVAKSLSSAWGALEHIAPDELEPDLGPVEEVQGLDGRRRFYELATAMSRGDWAQVVRLLLEQNADVAARRGGGPWIVETGGKLEVRHRQRGRELGDDPRALVHPYFISSMKLVGGQVLGKNVPLEEVA